MSDFLTQIVKLVDEINAPGYRVGEGVLDIRSSISL